jgi:hypothetical protein
MGSLFCLERDRVRTKWCAWIVTFIYLILLPFSVMLAITSIMVFDRPSITVPVGLSIIFMYFCIPLSIPLTLYLVWSRYSQENYRKSRLFCLIPLGIVTVIIVYDALVEAIRTLF